jgi:nitrite reductase/ring-hydroxylating ferredoxin subunit
MDRRSFINNSCRMCVGIAGFSSLSVVLNSCASLSVYKTSMNDKSITVPADSFLPEETSKIIRAEGLPYDILLVKENSTGYHSLEMICTHFSNHLVANKSAIVCNLHGSTFNFEGEVTNGPAIKALRKFPTRIAGNTIIIEIV